MAIWLVSQTILVVGLALWSTTWRSRVSATFRFLFYIPGRSGGRGQRGRLAVHVRPDRKSVRVHPARASATRSSTNTIAPSNLPVIFAIMAFWTGAGGWIVVMYGALNNIPHELIEAAEIDGSNVFQTALRIKLPLIRKWVVYMLVLSFAGGTQLFVEPQILGIATGGESAPQWSPNQLAWYLAFQYDSFNEAAAISVVLLVFGLLVAVLLVWRGKLFEVE